jgi:hypothetical protein
MGSVMIVFRFYNECLGVFNLLYKQTQSCADDLYHHKDVFINHNETLEKFLRLQEENISDDIY